MTRSNKRQTSKASTAKRTTRQASTKKKLDRLVHEAVNKVVAEYGDVLRRLGKEE